jgi:hypothetical protein
MFYPEYDLITALKVCQYASRYKLFDFKLGIWNIMIQTLHLKGITVFTRNNSHPIGHDKVDRCALLSAVCKAAEGAPCVLLRRKFHAVQQNTVLT